MLFYPDQVSTADTKILGFLQSGVLTIRGCCVQGLFICGYIRKVNYIKVVLLNQGVVVIYRAMPSC